MRRIVREINLTTMTIRVVVDEVGVLPNIVFRARVVANVIVPDDGMPGTSDTRFSDTFLADAPALTRASTAVKYTGDTANGAA